MADELIPLFMNDEHKVFVIKELAKNVDALRIKEQFDKLFYPQKIKAEAIFQLDKEFKDEILELRNSMYSDLSTLPFSFEWTRIAFAQSRIQYLLENPKIVKTVRKLTEEGKDIYEEVKEIDDANIRGYLDFCRREANDAKELALKKILHDIDRKDERIPDAGFKPVQVNIGFTVEDGEE